MKTGHLKYSKVIHQKRSTSLNVIGLQAWISSSVQTRISSSASTLKKPLEGKW